MDSIQQITMRFQIRHQTLFITAVYARCDALERLELWEKLAKVDPQDYPWLVGGDFNVTLHKEEKLEGLPFTQQEAMDVSHCISDCAIEEIKFSGSKYTWWNGRVTEDCNFERPDRVLANSAFLELYPLTKSQHVSQ